MIEEGEVRLFTLPEDQYATETDDVVGFMDENYLYVVPKKSYEHVARRCRAEGDSFPISRVALGRSLLHMGLVEPDKRGGKTSKTKIVAGRSRRFFWLIRDRMK